MDLYGSFSLNPGSTGILLHNLGFRHYGLDKMYCPFKVQPQDLVAAINGAIALNIKGFAVSSPHKENIVRCLSKQHELVKKNGVCNTVLNLDGRLVGYNTDYDSVKSCLLDNEIKSIYILGRGGMAKTVKYVCEELNINYIMVPREDWDKVVPIVSGYIFNATPVVIDQINVINASTETTMGKHLTLVQAFMQFKLYTGFELPVDKCKELLELK